MAQIGTRATIEYLNVEAGLGGTEELWKRHWALLHKWYGSTGQRCLPDTHGADAQLLC